MTFRTVCNPLRERAFAGGVEWSLIVPSGEQHVSWHITKSVVEADIKADMVLFLEDRIW